MGISLFHVYLLASSSVPCKVAAIAPGAINTLKRHVEFPIGIVAGESMVIECLGTSECLLLARDFACFRFLWNFEALLRRRRQQHTSSHAIFMRLWNGSQLTSVE